MFETYNFFLKLSVGASFSEVPQKHDLTMFPKCNICTDTFGLGMKLYTK
jgi:hypothetical protein